MHFLRLASSAVSFDGATNFFGECKVGGIDSSDVSRRASQNIFYVVVPVILEAAVQKVRQSCPLQHGVGNVEELTYKELYQVGSIKESSFGMVE